MAQGSEHYREADLGRFTRIGVITVAVLGMIGWFFFAYAGREVRLDNASPYARRSGTETPTTSASDSFECSGSKIQNWLEGQNAQPRR